MKWLLAEEWDASPRPHEDITRCFSGQKVHATPEPCIIKESLAWLLSCSLCSYVVSDESKQFKNEIEASIWCGSLTCVCLLAP